jgi:hypothetical protein
MMNLKTEKNLLNLDASIDGEASLKYEETSHLDDVAEFKLK